MVMMNLDALALEVWDNWFDNDQCDDVDTTDDPEEQSEF